MKKNQKQKEIGKFYRFAIFFRIRSFVLQGYNYFFCHKFDSKFSDLIRVNIISKQSFTFKQFQTNADIISVECRFTAHCFVRYFSGAVEKQFFLTIEAEKGSSIFAS